MLAYQQQFRWVSLEAAAGYQYRSFDDEYLGSIHVVPWRLGFEFATDPTPISALLPEEQKKSYAKVLFAQDFNDQGINDGYFEADRVTFDMGHTFLERIPVRLNGFYQRSKYEFWEGETASGSTEKRDDDTYKVYGTIGYKFLRWFTLSIKPGYERRNSNIVGRSYEDKVIMAQLDFSVRCGREIDLYSINHDNNKHHTPHRHHHPDTRFSPLQRRIRPRPGARRTSSDRGMSSALPSTPEGELQQEVDLTVSAKGIINAPFVGAIKAVGLTLHQLEERITRPLAKDYFVSPEVNIRVAGYHSLRYFISGAVNEPGLYEMTSRTTLVELIAKAGGVVPDRGNVAYILRGSAEEVVDGKSINEIISRKEPIKVDLESLLDRGDMSANLPLVRGDVVYLPLGKALNLAKSKIYVGGKIEKPGLYDYQPGLTTLSACILAGGFAKFSAPNRTKIIRKENGEQMVIEVDLNDVKEGDAPDVELKAGTGYMFPSRGYR